MELRRRWARGAVTCIGFNIVDPNFAVAWCDTEIYGPDDAPAGHAAKMAVGSLSATVGIGTGFLCTVQEGSELVGAALTFDALVAQLPDRLARSARDFERWRAARASDLWNCYAALGFSHRYGRVVGAVFDEAAQFRAALRQSFAAPLADVGSPMSQSDIVAAVHAQMIELRRRNPRAGAGMVVAAEVTPSRVACGQVFDLGWDVVPRRVRNLDDEGAAARRPVQQPRPDHSVVSVENAERRRACSGPRPAT